MSLLDNAALTFKVKSALILELGLDQVNVDSSEGIVTLQGTAPGEEVRAEAEQVALRCGARQVNNELLLDTLDAPAPAIPEDFPRITTPEGAPVVASPPLEETVRAALAADPRVNAHLVILRVENGIAYLTGRQETVEARDAATEIAARVPGILGVSNELEILPSV